MPQIQPIPSDSERNTARATLDQTLTTLQENLEQLRNSRHQQNFEPLASDSERIDYVIENSNPLAQSHLSRSDRTKTLRYEAGKEAEKVDAGAPLDIVNFCNIFGSLMADNIERVMEASDDSVAHQMWNKIQPLTTHTRQEECRSFLSELREKKVSADANVSKTAEHAITVLTTSAKAVDQSLALLKLEFPDINFSPLPGHDASPSENQAVSRMHVNEYHMDKDQYDMPGAWPRDPHPPGAHFQAGESAGVSGRIPLVVNFVSKPHVLDTKRRS